MQSCCCRASSELAEEVDVDPLEDGSHSSPGIIVVSYAYQQQSFKARVANRVTQMGYDVWCLDDDQCRFGDDSIPISPFRRARSLRQPTWSKIPVTRSISTSSMGSAWSPTSSLDIAPLRAESVESPRMRRTMSTRSAADESPRMRRTMSTRSPTRRLGTPSRVDREDGEALAAFARKVQDTEVVGIIFILSAAFSKNQQCLDEMQYAIKQCSLSKVILPVMYEDFEMSPEMMYMISNHSHTMAQPWVRTKCVCQGSKCDCTGDLLRREVEVSEDWLTGTGQGNFSVHFSTAMMRKAGNKRISESSTTSSEPKPQDVEWNPTTAHQSLLKDLTRDMNLRNIDEFKGFVGIIGSTAFFNPASEKICREIGIRLAAVLPDTVAVCTGGFTGTGECISRAFHDARIKKGRPHRTYMVLPTTDPNIETQFKDKAKTRVNEHGMTEFAPWDYGKTVFYGRSNAEKMAIMAVNSVLVMVEGGPGALKEALGCQQNGHWVVPVRCTGGATTNAAVGKQSPFAGLLHLASDKEKRWKWVLEAQQAWELLDAAAETDPAKVADAVVAVVTNLFMKQTELEQSTQISKGVRSVDNRPPGLTLLNDESELLDYMLDFNAVILFSGFGSKGQYHDMAEVEEIVDYLVKDLDETFGQTWLALYGGSPYVEGVKTTAHVARLLHKKHGKTILAIQCEFWGKEMLEPTTKDQYAHMAAGALYMYKTETVMDEHFHKKILFGGYYRFCGDKQERLCGASSVWFGQEFSKMNLPTAHCIIGGGSLTADDAQEGYSRQIPTFYARTKLLNKPPHVLRPKLSDKYGQMEHWANAMQVPREQWFPWAPSDLHTSID